MPRPYKNPTEDKAIGRVDRYIKAMQKTEENSVKYFKYKEFDRSGKHYLAVNFWKYSKLDGLKLAMKKFKLKSIDGLVVKKAWVKYILPHRGIPGRHELIFQRSRYCLPVWAIFKEREDGKENIL